MKLVRPAVGDARLPQERSSGVDDHEVVPRIPGQRADHRVKAVDHGRDDGEAFGEVIAAEVERRLKPRARAHWSDAIRDRVVVGMSDYGLAGQDRVPQSEEVKIGGANGAQRSLEARRVQA